MTVTLDPEGLEIRLLRQAAGGFAGKRVLEVGCGDGRLTWLYAAEAAFVTGIDPDEADIDQARQNVPDQLRGSVQFEAVSLSDFQGDPPYDLAILSWSL